MRSPCARRALVLSLVLASSVLFSAVSHATIISVRQDGTGDFDNLTAAVAAASADDSISVEPGSYIEGATVNIGIALTVFSTDGRDVTTISGANAYRVFETTSAGIRLEGLSIVDGVAPGASPTGAGAVFMWPGSQVTMQDCVIRGHTADWGGAIYVTDSNIGANTMLTANGCLFTDNYSTGTAGAVYVVNGAVANLTDCTFTGNETGLKGGVFHVIRGQGNFERCLFQSNRSGDVAGAIFFEDSSGLVRECTFYDHTSPGLIAGTIVVELTSGTQITRNIFAGETAGFGIRYFNSNDPHSCNVFWDNAAGAVGASALAPDEVVADPRFCDPANDVFTISDNSPAAAANSACGQPIGAFPVACNLPPLLTQEPLISSIEDVPDDDGRQVRIRWVRSVYDAPAQPFVINGYGIYRRAPSSEAQNTLRGEFPRSRARETSALAQRQPGVDLDGWDYIATVPARGDSIYQYVAPTLCDTHPSQICWSVFFVSAMTPDPLTFFDSPPDSGQSTDDLPPAPPQGLSASTVAAGVEVLWDAEMDPSTVECHIYRGLGDFEVTPSSQVGTTLTNTWVDADGNHSVWSYKVTTVDLAGNESTPAFWQPTQTSALPQLPVRYALHRNEPNPFNPMTTIYYDVPIGGGLVALRVYDARGNLVRTLLDGFEPAGRTRSVIWNGLDDAGRRVSSGVYFCRLQAAGFERAVRLVLLE